MQRDYLFVHMIMLFVVLAFVVADDDDSDYDEYDYDYMSLKSHYPESTICSNLPTIRYVDITQFTGFWYGNEILVHSKQMPTVTEYDSCVHVYIADITEHIFKAMYKTSDYNEYYRRVAFLPHRPYNLHFVWTANDKNLDYNFKYVSSRPGIWLNTNEQRGAMAIRSDYRQFHGSVKVLQAFNDHMVLTFCDSFEDSSVYTVVLTRNISGLHTKELGRIRELCHALDLPVEHISTVCSGSMAAATATATTSIYCALTTLLVMSGWNLLHNAIAN